MHLPNVCPYRSCNEIGSWKNASDRLRHSSRDRSASPDAFAGGPGDGAALGGGAGGGVCGCAGAGAGAGINSGES